MERRQFQIMVLANYIYESQEVFNKSNHRAHVHHNNSGVGQRYDFFYIRDIYYYNKKEKRRLIKI